MKKIKRLIVLLCAACVLCAFGLVGCKDDGTQTPYTFDLTASSVEVAIDDTYQIFIKGGADYAVSYKSSNESIVTVDGDGILTGQSEGSAEVTVNSNNCSRVLNVTVYDSGEVPALTVNNVYNDVLRIVIGDDYSIDGTVKYRGTLKNADISYTSLNTSVATLNGDTIHANSLGSSTVKVTATYKKWTLERLFTVEVVEDVNVYAEVNTVELSYTDVAGQAASYQINDVVVKEGGNTVSSPVIIWETSDENVATVNNGLITGVNSGQAEIRAVYIKNDIKYWAYVKVNVIAPYLASPTNFSYSDDDALLTWDAVDYADKYILTVNEEEFELTENEYVATESFGDTLFTVKAVSNNDQILDSEVSTFRYNIPTWSLTERVLDYKSDTEVKKITAQSEFNEENGEEIYYADCSNAIPWKDGTIKQYGYNFRAVYLQDGFYNPATGMGKKGLSALMPQSAETTFYRDKVISMWVYSESECVLRYIKDKDTQGADILAEVKVPALKWTKVTFTIATADFARPLFANWITSSADFYFTDLRVSEYSYANKQTTLNSKFFFGMETEDLFEQLTAYQTSDVSLSNTTLINLLKEARTAYDYYTVDATRPEPANLSHFIELETVYLDLLAAPVITKINALTEANAVTLDDKADIEDARRAYEDLLPATQSHVTNYNALKDREVALVKNTLDGLPVVNDFTTEYMSVVIEIREYYESLIDTVKTAVSDEYLKKLEAYEAKVIELTIVLTINMIAELPAPEAVTLDNKEDVLAAKTQYDSLLDSQKNEIGAEYVAKLDTCVVKLNVLLLIETIDAFPKTENIDMYDGNAIYSAQQSYDNLPEEEKTRIDNYDVLQEIKTYYDNRWAFAFDYIDGEDAFTKYTMSTRKAYADISFAEHDTYGRIAVINVSTGGESDDNYKHVALKLKTDNIFSKINRGGIDTVTFSFYLSKNTQDNMKFNGESLSYTYSSEEWYTVTMTAADFLSVNGIFEKTWHHNGEIRFSNFYLSYYTDEAARVASYIQVLPTVDEMDVFDGYNINDVYNQFNALSETDKNSVSQELQNKLTSLYNAWSGIYAYLYSSNTDFYGSVINANGTTYTQYQTGIDAEYGYYVSQVQQSTADIYITLKQSFVANASSYDVVYISIYNASSDNKTFVYDFNGIGYGNGGKYINGELKHGWNVITIPVSYLNNTVSYGIKEADAGVYMFSTPILAKLVQTENGLAAFDYGNGLTSDITEVDTNYKKEYAVIPSFEVIYDGTYGEVMKITGKTPYEKLESGKYANQGVGVKVNYQLLTDLCEKYGATQVSFYIKCSNSGSIDGIFGQKFGGTNGVEGFTKGEWSEFTFNIGDLTAENCYIFEKDFINEINGTSTNPIYITNFFIKLPTNN